MASPFLFCFFFRRLMMRISVQRARDGDKDKTLKWITSNYSSYIKSIKNVLPAFFSSITQRKTNTE